MEQTSRKLLRMLQKDGSVVDRVSSDHHTLKHAEQANLITLTYPRKDLSVGLVRSIYRTAGWKP